MIRLFSLMLILLFSLTAAYARQKEAKTEAATEEVPLLKRETVIGGLPCFKCHDFKAFLEKDAKGVFSHKRHRGFDVHCNQCHEVKGHMPPEIISSACKSCHALKPLAYDGGGMGRVTFSHGFHTKAFQCGHCHIKHFPTRKSEGAMKMDDMYQGRGCGACHDGKKAFSAQECTACHKQ